MALERTFSILKPDVTRRNLTGAVNARIEAAGLRIIAQKRVHMTSAQAETFYGVHRERPFFGELVEMMTAAPVVVQVLEGDNAIAKYREVMGATNPEKAAPARSARTSRCRWARTPCMAPTRRRPRRRKSRSGSPATRSSAKQIGISISVGPSRLTACANAASTASRVAASACGVAHRTADSAAKSIGRFDRLHADELAGHRVGVAEERATFCNTP